MLGRRKRRKNKLSKILFREQDFWLEELRKEWEEIQRGAKREELIRRTKEAGFMMTKTILVLAAFAGVLTVAVVAPNIFAAFGRIKGRRGFFDKQEFNRATAYLRKKKLIKMEKAADGPRLEITDQGLEKALLVSYRNLKIKSQKRWDGIWRIVAFDIPDKHKWERESFRNKLKEMGFYPMQESVFVSPYPCEQEVESLTSLFFLKNYIKFIKTTSISNDEDLKEYFQLT